MLQDLILFTRLCGTGCITQWLSYSFDVDQNGLHEMICTTAPGKGQIGGVGP